MNKNDKKWILSKIDTLQEISFGINNALKSSNQHLCNAMSMWIDNFIKEIHEKIGIN